MDIKTKKCFNASSTTYDLLGIDKSESPWEKIQSPGIEDKLQATLKNNEKLSFTKENFPEFIIQKANQEIESLTKQNKYQEAAEMRDKIISINNEIHRQLRLKKYGTADWFMAKSETEIFFLPTQISVVDSLIFEMNN